MANVELNITANIGELKAKLEQIELQLKKIEAESTRASNGVRSMGANASAAAGGVGKLGKESETAAAAAKNIEKSKEGIKKTGDAAQHSAEQIKGIQDTSVTSLAGINKLTTLGTGMFMKFAGAIGAAFGIAAIARFAKAAHEAYEQSIKQERRLTAAMGMRQEMSRELIKYAGEARDKYAISRSEILQVETLAATHNLNAENIKKVTQASIEFAAVMGDDIQSAAQKVLATYEGIVGRLTRVDKAFGQLTKEELRNGAAADLIIRKYAGMRESAITDGERAALSWKKLVTTLGRYTTPIFDAINNALEGTFNFFAKTFGKSYTAKIDDERQALNRLAGQLQNVNIPAERRNAIIAELRQKYPDFLGDLKDEEISYEVIARKLSMVNDQYAAKIRLQQQEEEFKDLGEEQVDALDRQADAAGRQAEEFEKMINVMYASRMGTQAKAIEEMSTLDARVEFARKHFRQTASSWLQSVEEMKQANVELGEVTDRISKKQAENAIKAFKDMLSTGMEVINMSDQILATVAKYGNKEDSYFAKTLMASKKMLEQEKNTAKESEYSIVKLRKMTIEQLEELLEVSNAASIESGDKLTNDQIRNINKIIKEKQAALDKEKEMIEKRAEFEKTLTAEIRDVNDQRVDDYVNTLDGIAKLDAQYMFDRLKLERQLDDRILEAKSIGIRDFTAVYNWYLDSIELLEDRHAENVVKATKEAYEETTKIIQESREKEEKALEDVDKQLKALEDRKIELYISLGLLTERDKLLNQLEDARRELSDAMSIDINIRADSDAAESQKKQAALTVESWKVAIQEIEKQISDFDAQNVETGLDIFTKLGLTSENIEAAQELIGVAINSIGELLDVQMEASQARIEVLNEEYNEQQRVYEEQKRLSEQGYANSVNMERRRLEEITSERKKAFDEEKMIKKQQMQLETISQAVSVVSASINIFKAESWKGAPGIITSIAAIATMLAFIVKLKAQAKALATYREGGELVKGNAGVKGGLVRGPSHEEGGVVIPRLHAEVEGGEYVVNRRSTVKYRDLIEAINEDDTYTMNYFFNRRLSDAVDGRDNDNLLTVAEYRYLKDVERLTRRLEQVVTDTHALERIRQTSDVATLMTSIADKEALKVMMASSTTDTSEMRRHMDTLTRDITTLRTELSHSERQLTTLMATDTAATQTISEHITTERQVMHDTLQTDTVRERSLTHIDARMLTTEVRDVIQGAVKHDVQVQGDMKDTGKYKEKTIVRESTAYAPAVAKSDTIIQHIAGNISSVLSSKDVQQKLMFIDNEHDGRVYIADRMAQPASVNTSMSSIYNNGTPLTAMRVDHELTREIDRERLRAQNATSTVKVRMAEQKEIREIRDMMRDMMGASVEYTPTHRIERHGNVIKRTVL